jgi:hypothetical protein
MWGQTDVFTLCSVYKGTESTEWYLSSGSTYKNHVPEKKHHLFPQDMGVGLIVWNCINT